jgi:sec-independent protein translocase protein TatA
MGSGLLSPTHMIFVATLALLLFGAKRLPEVGRSLGTGLREFKTTVSGMEGSAGPAEDFHDVRPVADVHDSVVAVNAVHSV